jgi:hypothetical protein
MTELELTTLMYNLNDRGIKLIKIEYNGEGRDGDIFGIVYSKLLDANDKFKAPWNAASLMDVDTELYMKVEQLAINILNMHYSDWTYEKGSYGFIGMLVPTGEYEIEHSERVINVNMSDMTSNIFKDQITN